MSSAVSGQEVFDVLMKAVRGESDIHVKECTWDEAYAGDVYFEIDGWIICIFNDCDSVDYVSDAVSPDGREGEFNQWMDDGCEPVGMYQDKFGNTDDLEKTLKAARQCTPKP